MYGQSKVEDENASFNSTVSRLRKYLKNSPLPPGEYLISGGGILRFDGPVEVESDAWEFEQTAERFGEEKDRQEKLRLCEKACDLYYGDFLPQLSNEPWVIRKNKYYQRHYFIMLQYLLEVLKEKGDYAAISRLSLRALEIEPLGEGLFWRLDSLTAQGCLREAADEYETALNQVQKMKNSGSRALLERLREAGKRLQAPGGGTEKEIHQCLWEETAGQGAYICTLPSFVDQFRILKRLAEREKIAFALLLFTIRKADRKRIDNEKNSRGQEVRLQEAFQTNLRAGDVCARYSENQYLLLCMNTEAEQAAEIAMRLDGSFRKDCRGRYSLGYQLLDNG